jgi:hypothetical protein
VPDRTPTARKRVRPVRAWRLVAVVSRGVVGRGGSDVSEVVE